MHANKALHTQSWSPSQNGFRPDAALVEFKPTTAEQWDEQLDGGEVNHLDGRKLLALPENRFLAPLVKRDQQILEAGSGNGRYVYAFAQAGAQSVGIDFSQKLTRRCRDQAARLKLHNASFVNGDIMAMQFQAGTFDLYTSFGVYEHFTRGQHPILFSEAYRVLKPGGTIYLEVPQLWSAWTVRRQLRYWFRQLCPPALVWQRHLSRRYMIACAEAAGFQTLEAQVIDAWYGFEKGFSLKDKTRMGLPNPFYYLRPVFRRITDFCERKGWLGHSLVYIGRKPLNTETHLPRAPKSRLARTLDSATTFTRRLLG